MRGKELYMRHHRKTQQIYVGFQALSWVSHKILGKNQSMQMVIKTRPEQGLKYWPTIVYTI